MFDVEVTESLIGPNGLRASGERFRCKNICRNMLARGFTTVRDTGGADWGIKIALETGIIPGPRLFIAGRAIGPTSGHSDSRRRTDFAGAPCKCCNAMAFCMEIADGADAVRKAADLLADYGWLARDAVPTGVSGGRPSDRFLIHPLLLKGGA